MSDKKISVDDLIEEIQSTRSKSARISPSSDMKRVDEIIEGILTEKKQQEIVAEKKALSEREKQEFKKEIKMQTKTLTKQYEKLKKESLLFTKPITRKPATIEEVNLNDLKNEKIEPKKAVEIKNNDIAAKRVTTSSIPIPTKEQLEKERRELKKARTVAELTAHFGNFKIEDESVEKSYGKSYGEKKPDIANEPKNETAEINYENYRKFKQNRKDKINNFNLNRDLSETMRLTPDELSMQKHSNDVDLSTEKRVKPVAPTSTAVKETEIVSEPPVSTPAEVYDDITSSTENDMPVSSPTVTDEPNYEAVKATENDDNGSDEIEFNQEFEYKSKDETERFKGIVTSNFKRAKKDCIFTGILALLSILLSFTKTDSTGVRLFYFINIPSIVFVGTSLMLLMITLVSARHSIITTLENIKQDIPTKDILPLLTLLVCIAVNIVYMFNPDALLNSSVRLFTPVSTFLVFINQLSKFDVQKQISLNFDFISSDNEKYAVTRITDPKKVKMLTKGTEIEEPVLLKNSKVGFFKNFMNNSTKYNSGDSYAQKLTLFVFPLSFIAGLVGFIFSNNIYIGLTILTACMLIATGITSLTLISSPLKDTSDIIRHFFGMMPDYNTIEKFKNTDTILIDAEALFPEKSVILHGIKTFQGKRVDDAIVNAASVLCQIKSTLAPVFLNIIANNKSILRPVDSILYEDLMGISAWVDNNRILIGNRDLLVNHSVAVPPKGYEDKYSEKNQEVIYVATNGELCAAFIVQYTIDKGVADVINILEKYNITAIVKSVDACITSNMLACIFDTENYQFKVIPSMLHDTFDEEVAETDEVDSMLGNRGDLFGFAITIAAMKRLYHCINVGKIYHIVVGAIGATLLLFLLFTGNLAKLDILFLFTCILLPGLVFWFYERNLQL